MLFCFLGVLNSKGSICTSIGRLLVLVSAADDRDRWFLHRTIQIICLVFLWRHWSHLVLLRIALAYGSCLCDFCGDLLGIWGLTLPIPFELRFAATRGLLFSLGRIIEPHHLRHDLLLWLLVDVQPSIICKFRLKWRRLLLPSFGLLALIFPTGWRRLYCGFMSIISACQQRNLAFVLDHIINSHKLFLVWVLEGLSRLCLDRGLTR